MCIRDRHQGNLVRSEPVLNEYISGFQQRFPIPVPRQLSPCLFDVKIHRCKATLVRPSDVAIPMHSGVSKTIEVMGFVSDELSGRENGVRECFSAKRTFACVG